jgi:hypothetical protein
MDTVLGLVLTAVLAVQLVACGTDLLDAAGEPRAVEDEGTTQQAWTATTTTQPVEKLFFEDDASAAIVIPASCDVPALIAASEAILAARAAEAVRDAVLRSEGEALRAAAAEADRRAARWSAFERAVAACRTGQVK